jgi:hypothetical protein
VTIVCGAGKVDRLGEWRGDGEVLGCLKGKGEQRRTDHATGDGPRLKASESLSLSLRSLRDCWTGPGAATGLGPLNAVASGARAVTGPTPLQRTASRQQDGHVFQTHFCASRACIACIM